jgi:hypothetical protein
VLRSIPLALRSFLLLRSWDRRSMPRAGHRRLELTAKTFTAAHNRQYGRIRWDGRCYRSVARCTSSPHAGSQTGYLGPSQSVSNQAAARSTTGVRRFQPSLAICRGMGSSSSTRQGSLVQLQYRSRERLRRSGVRGVPWELLRNFWSLPLG